MSGQVCPRYSDPEIPEAHVRQMLGQIAALKREAALNPDDPNVASAP
jgi:hypothetical protein